MREGQDGLAYLLLQQVVLIAINFLIKLLPGFKPIKANEGAQRNSSSAPQLNLISCDKYLLDCMLGGVGVGTYFLIFFIFLYLIIGRKS